MKICLDRQEKVKEHIVSQKWHRRACKLSRQKSRYIKELASEVANGYDPEQIRKIDDYEAVEELTKFKGIGMWSAELILITTLRRMNLCVPDDLGARKAVSHFYYDGKLQPGDVVREFSKRWGKIQSLGNLLFNLTLGLMQRCIA